jgi:ribosomal protein S18 acetylase RimI-like enzyme
MTEISLRHAEPEDYQPIIAVLDEWWGGRHMAAMLPKLFFVHFRPTSFVAEDEGRIVGFLCGFVSQTLPTEAYTHFVGVHPGYRFQGLGRALYERFFVAARQLGCDTVRCVTSPVNRGSVAFHRSLDFVVERSETSIDGVPVAVNYDGAGGDRVLFSRPLSRDA